MTPYLSKLIDAGSRAKSPTTQPAIRAVCTLANSSIVAELEEVLSHKNGFWAFESALNVLPSEAPDFMSSIPKWNDPENWKKYFGDHESVLFFAEDLFGGQFGIGTDSIYRLHPETAELVEHSANLESWAKTILKDLDFETGWSIGRAWQETHGPLKNEFRLIPRVPFTLGGEYCAENLVTIRCDRAMREYARLATQIRDIPDGQSIIVNDWVGEKIFREHFGKR